MDLLSDLLEVDDVLLIIKNNAAVSEIRSNSLHVKQKDKWITIGDNNGPAHMHINSESIRTAEFIEEDKPDRTSFSVHFFDEKHERILGAFFTKMYDSSNNIDSERKKIYEKLYQKHGLKIQF